MWSLTRNPDHQPKAKEAVFPNAEAPCRELALQLLCVPVATGRGHFALCFTVLSFSAVTRELPCLSSCAWYVVQRHQIFSLEAFLQLGSRNDGCIWPSLPPLMEDSPKTPFPSSLAPPMRAHPPSCIAAEHTSDGGCSQALLSPPRRARDLVLPPCG